MGQLVLAPLLLALTMAMFRGPGEFWIYLAPLAVVLWLFGCAATRRMHDLKHPALILGFTWAPLFGLAELGAMIGIGILALAPGNPAPNTHGPPPN